MFRFTIPIASNIPKSLFYIFHLSPEFVAAMILICTNTRVKFGTGAWGDYRFSWRFGWGTPKSLYNVEEDRMGLFQDIETGYEKQNVPPPQSRYPTKPSRMHRPSVSIERWIPHKPHKPFKGEVLPDSPNLVESRHTRPQPALVREKRSSALSFNCTASPNFD